MLKLNTSFSKKIPGDVQFSSKSFHASVEIELPDGLSPQQLQDRIHQTFQLVRNSVETELGSGNGGVPETPPVQNNAAGIPAQNGNGHASGSFQPVQNGNGRKTGPASEKQVKYLIDLVAQNGTDMAVYLKRYGVASAYDLTRDACSKLIDEIGGKK